MRENWASGSRGRCRGRHRHARRECAKTRKPRERTAIRHETTSRKYVGVRVNLTVPVGAGVAESGRGRRRLLRAVRARVVERALTAGWRRRAGMRPGLAPGASNTSMKNEWNSVSRIPGQRAYMRQLQQLRSTKGDHDATEMRM